MKRLLLLCFALLTFSHLHAQFCSTPGMTEFQRRSLLATSLNADSYHRSSGQVRNVSLNINIMVYTNGPITNINFVKAQIDTANTYFINAGIEFSICNVNYIPFTSVVPFWDIQYEMQLAQTYDLAGCINIYYVDYVANASAYAFYPTAGSPDHVVMGQNLSGEILAHELGHSFFLDHTHGAAHPVYGTNELVNGSNCATAGDMICDTPADPNLYYNRVDSLCNYTDTVTTDSLGFLFNPDTKNIMSYTRFKCYEQFSSGQYNRISYVLNHERAYLKSGSAFSSAITAPAHLCIYDSAVTLNAVPAGGSFSGAGVSGNTFDPAVAGAGFHLISYSAPGTPANQETTDQYYSYYDTTIALTNVSQSITAGENEDLLAVSINTILVSAQIVVLNIYEGNGISGLLLASDTVNIASDSTLNWLRLQLSSPLHLTAGSNYTFEVVFNDTTFITSNRYNVYNAGSANAGADISFITHVLMDVPFCGNVTRTVIYVSDPPEPVITNLLPVYCIATPPISINAVPSGGTADIDGTTVTAINASTLGSGTHSLYYTYTNNFGCTNDSTFTILVDDSTQINIPAVICSDDSIISIDVYPAGGTIYYDGIVITSPVIEPDTITPGLHQISYVNNKLYPGERITDQDNFFTSSNSSYSTSFGQVPWQSFTAGSRGYLARFELGLYIADTVLVTYNLYKGEGLTGQLLETNSKTIYVNSMYSQEFEFTPYQVLLEKDSVYTFSLAFSNDILDITQYNDSVYQGGNASMAFLGLNETDFKFRTFIDPADYCMQDSVSVSFNLSQSPAVDLGPDVIISAGQNISLDAANPGCSYQWSTGESTQQINFNASPGNYQVIVVVTNSDGCSATDTLNISVVTSIEEISAEILISPNPVSDQLRITSNSLVTGVTIYDLSGRVIHESQPSADKRIYELDTKRLTSGVYILKAFMQNKVIVTRFLKE